MRWGFLIWELIFYLLRTFCPHLGSFCVVSSFTTFRPNFTSGLLQAIFTTASDNLIFYWALSEDSGFQSYPSRPEVYLVKNVVRLTTTMECSNYWGYDYMTQHSYPNNKKKIFLNLYNCIHYFYTFPLSLSLSVCTYRHVVGEIVRLYKYVLKARLEQKNNILLMNSQEISNLIPLIVWVHPK